MTASTPLRGARSQGGDAAAAAALAIAMLGLLALAERAGLPADWVRLFLAAIALVALATLLALSRTAQESAFSGLHGLADPFAGGLVLAVAIVGTQVALAPTPGPAAWLAALLGAPAGLLGAHLALRLGRRRGGQGPAAGGWRSAARGLGLLAIGLAVLHPAAETAAREAARLFGMNAPAGSALALAIPLIAVLLGGARGALALASGAAAAGVVALAVLLGVGLIELGPLPLPGQSEADTLRAIAEARRTWGVAAPTHLAAWPPLASLLAGEAPSAFAAAACLGAAVALAAAPAVPVQRRSVGGAAIVGLLALPLVAVAIGGYAVEAAATRFVGASIARPPAALVETASLGLVQVCGSTPTTAEALRIACGVGPRDAATLGWSQIRPTPAFLDGGLAAALGLPSSVGFATDALRLGLALAAAAIGLWLAAQGLGRHLIGSRLAAAGLASLRLGLTRLAALIIAGAMLVVLLRPLPIPAEALLGALGFGAALLLTLSLAAAFSRRPATPAEPVRARQRRRAPQGEAA